LYLDVSTVSDEGLAHLRHCSGLTYLDIFEANVSDAGLDHLYPLQRLRTLECCGGHITNLGLYKIGAHLSTLTHLNLSQHDAINDYGLAPLSYLKQLQHLNLSGTAITHRGLTFLHGCPNLKHMSCFGCTGIKSNSNKIKQLPVGLQIGLDEGVLVIEP
jgi:hypothetical protein